MVEKLDDGECLYELRIGAGFNQFLDLGFCLLLKWGVEIEEVLLLENEKKGTFQFLCELTRSALSL